MLIISVDCSDGDDESDDDVKLASESDTFKSLVSVELSLFSLEVSSFLLSMVSLEFLPKTPTRKKKQRQNLRLKSSFTHCY